MLLCKIIQFGISRNNNILGQILNIREQNDVKTQAKVGSRAGQHDIYCYLVKRRVIDANIMKGSILNKYEVPTNESFLHMTLHVQNLGPETCMGSCS